MCVCAGIVLGVHHVGRGGDDDGTADGGREDRSGGHPGIEGGMFVLSIIAL